MLWWTKTITIKLSAFANIKRKERDNKGRVDTAYIETLRDANGMHKLAFYVKYNKPWKTRLRTSQYNNFYHSRFAAGRAAKYEYNELILGEQAHFKKYWLKLNI